jgi:hypothetical protein
VAIWSRIRLAETDADALAALFLRFSELAHATKAWLESGAPAIKGERPNAVKSTAMADRLQVLRKAAVPGSKS